ncbi:hypothetical protein ES705_40235 [subsurface metagenome]
MKTVKQNVIETINHLPDDVTYNDIIEKIRFMQEVEEGIKQADEGKLITHEEVERSLSKWLK